MTECVWRRAHAAIVATLFTRLAIVAAMLAAPSHAHADVVRLDLQRRATIAGAVPYEILAGIATFSVDPRNPHDAIIVDLARAPHDLAGRVGFTADVCILKPVDPSAGNGAVLVDVLNRGNKTVMRTFNRAPGGNALATEAELGDRFLMRQGFTIVWVGWQADLVEANGVMRITAPIATEVRAPITGWARAEHTPFTASATLPLADAGHIPYAVVDPESTQHVLTVRDAGGARQVLPRGTWRFAGDAGKPPAAFALDGGFQPGRTYELVYRVRDPVVAGLGLAAIRDVASFFKHDRRAPIRAARALAFGFSQSGRLLRTFLYDGFNTDEAKRLVFDGFLIHGAGASRGSFNQRFAQPSSSGASATLFPFADSPQTESDTRRTGALLERLGEPRPKIMYANTSVEYWWLGRAALQHTTLDGRTDLALPDHVRAYFFAGTQHEPAAFPPAVEPSARAASNPNDCRWALRALLVALDLWVQDGTTPPASALPRIGDETLVPFAQVKLPPIPGLDRPRTLAEPFVRLDAGPEIRRGIADYEPPHEGAPLPILLPQVDADGNELGGIRLPDVAVPLATYTGWSLRKPDRGGSLLVGLTGAFVPFARTREERQRRGDPRLSIAERYADSKTYLGRARAAAMALADKGYLLEDDVTAMMTESAGRWLALAGTRGPV